MQIAGSYLVLDASDIRREADFWASVLDGTATTDVPAGDDERWIEIVVHGRTVLAVQHAPDHIAPTWPLTDPTAQHSMQMHPDLYVPRRAVASACEEAIRTGATLVQEAESLDARRGFVVLADPAGHPFCICWDEDRES